MVANRTPTDIAFKIVSERELYEGARSAALDIADVVGGEFKTREKVRVEPSPEEQRTIASCT